MKKLLMAVSATALLWSCEKKDLLQDSAPASQKRTADSAGDGKWDVLGYGYDATGEYAHSNSSTYRVVDVERLKLEHPDYVEELDINGGDYVWEAGHNAEEFSKKLTASVKVSGGVKLFKGSIEANFSKEDKWSSKYVYATYNDLTINRSLKVNLIDPAFLQGYLSPVFAQQAQTATPEQLVHSFGTHVLTNIGLGGQMSLIYQAETNATDRTTAAKAGAGFSFGKVFNSSAEVAANATARSSNFNETITARTVGGNAEQTVSGVTISPDGTPRLTINTQGWKAGITKENSELVKINPNGLVPLYELIADPAKKAAVRTYIEQYIANNGVSVTPEGPPAAYHSKLAVFHEFFHQRGGSHFFTTDVSEAKPGVPFWQGGQVRWDHNWVHHGGKAVIYKEHVPGTVPLKRYFHAGNFDYLYDTGDLVRDGEGGWRSQKVAGYIYPTQMHGSVPLHEYYHAGMMDHFLTTDLNVVHHGIGGWSYHRIVGYVYPYPIPGGPVVQ